MKIPERMRLNRMIALTSELSRRAAEEAIKEGRIKVGEEVVTDLATTVDPLNDKVYLDENLLRIDLQRKYLAFNKPRGMIVSKSDEHGRPTIWDLLGDLRKELNAVGRLDFDSEGLIILTNDGEFINMMTHPKHGIWKTYRVWVNGKPSSEALGEMKKGMKAAGESFLPAKIKVVQLEKGNTLLEVSIREGKNRQIRKMFDAIDSPVRSLKRTSIGPVKLGQIDPGKWRQMRPDEVIKLIALARLAG